MTDTSTENEIMTNTLMRWLSEPFAYDDLEWRLLRTNGTVGGRLSAIIVPYVTARAVQDRLDDVVGAENWWNEFRPAPNGGVLCGLTIVVDGREVTKWDGAENTKIEPVKGGLSDAMKRAAVQWGIGRYLYYLPVMFADIKTDYTAGMMFGYDNQKNKFYWEPNEKAKAIIKETENAK